jgi:hypothetical protein
MPFLPRTTSTHYVDFALGFPVQWHQFGMALNSEGVALLALSSAPFPGFRRVSDQNLPAVILMELMVCVTLSPSL